ncbi:MAG: RNA-binding S4 domain-containing protein [Negativicutes bacterium]|nr:RNA-binding S4 domain-containing protein [Negativicutes bacterium]
MDEIAIHSPSIQLDQLLKWAGIIETGGQVKPMLAEKQLTVNGAVVTERRKKIFPGDVVELKGVGKWTVTAAG